jgi:hypothetical protein
MLKAISTASLRGGATRVPTTWGARFRPLWRPTTWPFLTRREPGKGFFPFPSLPLQAPLHIYCSYLYSLLVGLVFSFLSFLFPFHLFFFLSFSVRHPFNSFCFCIFSFSVLHLLSFSFLSFFFISFIASVFSLSVFVYSIPFVFLSVGREKKFSSGP